MHTDRSFTYLIAAPGVPGATFPQSTLGIEMTDPALAARCGLGNIDPQHGAGATATAPAAIEVCARFPVPAPGACLATIRPDADAIGAMALLELRASGREPDVQMYGRIAAIAASDRFDHGPWPGPWGLPTIADPAQSGEPVSTESILAACAADRSVPLEERVGVFMRYLARGDVPEGYRASVAAREARLVRSLASGATRISRVAGGRVAVVISLEPGALRLGYRLAPVVVALNPAAVFPSGLVGRKYTVARWHEADADLSSFGARVAALEPGWGGQAGIKGSPQDRPSALTVEQILRLLDMAEVSARVA